MSEAATTSINPNIPVGAETTTASKANSSVTFDDVTDSGEAAAKSKPKLVKKDDAEKAEPKTKARGDNKEEGNSFDDAEDEKPASKAKAEKEPDGKSKADKAEAPKPAKPKVHKVKAGDSTIDIPGDAMIEVPVNGKMEQMTFEDFRSQVSGKINWDKKNNELHRDKTEFAKQRDGLNSLVENLFKKSQEDPENAWDFLAEMTKQDPVKLKGSMLRKQFEDLLPLFEMSEAERETWFKDRERDWRDRAHESRTRADSEREAQVADQAKRVQTSERYGIDEAEYEATAKLVGDYLKQADPKFDGKVTVDHVIYANRKLMARDVIEATVPQLENHEQFGVILEDIVSDLVRHPGMTREKLASLLQDVWGDDGKTGLKKLAKKANPAHASDDERPTQRRSEKRDPVNFDDLD